MTVRQHFDPSRLFWDAAYRDGDDHEHWNDGGGAEGASVYGQPVFLSWLDQELADEGRLVLDVGCGRGGLIGELAGRSPGRAVRWLGVDLSLAALAGAGDGGCGPRRRSPVALVAARAAALPLAAASVDAVVERGMLHGFEPPARQRALAELARALRPGSCCWLEGAREDDEESGLTGLDGPAFVGQLQAAGLRVVASGDSGLVARSGRLAARWWRLERFG